MMEQDFLEIGRLIIDFPLSCKFIKELYINEEANEHSTLFMRLVSDKVLTQDEILRLADVPVQVYTPDGGTVFSGTCISAGLHNLSSYSEITVEAKSWSFLSDVEKHSRTFQDPGKSLSQMVDTTLGSYGYKISLQEDIPVSIMLSQQEETDWHFMKRIANQFGFMLFADSKSSEKRISIGVVPFSEQALSAELNSAILEKDIVSYWQTRNGSAAGASAYEFLKQGYQIPDLTIGVGHAVSGGPSPRVITKSIVNAGQGLLTNSVTLTYQGGAYPPVERSITTGPSVVSGTVLAVSGNDVQVSFNAGGPGGPRWIPYANSISNECYCMPDVGDSVFCYYENDGTVVCLGSKHVNTGAPDFSKPDEKVLTANNRMIRQKKDGITITGNRPEIDGLGGERIKITLSDTDGIEILASKEVNITAEHTLLIQSNNLDEVKEQPTEWFDSERKGRMADFDNEQTIGSNRYIADGGNTSYNAGWDLTKTLGGNLVKGFVDDITSPFQLVSTIGGLISPPAAAPEQPQLSFDKVDEYQIMILGLQSCTLQVEGASVYFSESNIIMAGPKFRWLGFERFGDYPQVSESQQTFMDSVMDVVQLGIDIVGCIPGCNVVCGGLNAGISLLRGDYYGAMSGLAGMLCPGGGLVTRSIKMIGEASDTARKVIKALKILKAGALLLNAAIQGGQGAMELYDKMKNGEFDITNPDDLALLTSVLRSGLTMYQSGKTIYDETRKPSLPEGDAARDGDDDPNRKPDTDDPADSTKQTPDNETTCKDPIDVITGSQKIVQTDFVVKDVVGSFALVRTYQSVHTNAGGLLGSKWYLNIGSWITIQEHTATVIMPDMHLEIFTKKEEQWVNNRGGNQSIRLEENKDGYCVTVVAEKKRYIYDTIGKLISIMDRNHNRTWLRYVNSTLMEIAFASGQVLTFSYKDDKIASIKDVIGRTVSYRYDGDLLTEVEYPNHGVVQYAYTPEGYLQEIVDQNGHKYVHNDYDMQGRVTRQELYSGQEYIVLYDDSSRVNTFLTPQSGQRFEYHYSKDQLLLKKIYTDGTLEEMAYDQFQNKVLVKDRMGGELHRRFDERGKLLEETLPNGLITSFEYDENSNMIRQWDNAGRAQEYAYDKNGNCILIRSAIDEGHWKETAFTYDTNGRILSLTDPRGNHSTVTYQNAGGGIQSFTTAEGAVFQYTYDEAGRCMSVTNELGRTEYAYNHMDYRTMVVDPLGNTTKYFFDMLCNITKIIQPNHYDKKVGDGVGTRFIYDALDEQIQRIDPLGNVYAILRDLEENIAKEINPNCYHPETKDGEGIGYEYDPDDRRIKIQYPNGGIERIKYDANGNIIKKIRPEQYDEKTDDGPGYTYEYDCVNRLVQITDPEGNVVQRYVYDLCGNIIKKIDAQGCLAGANDDSRTGTLYRYNGIGWLVEKREPVKAEDGAVLYRVTRYSYDPAGNMTRERRLQNFQSETSNEGPVHSISFDYDKDNRRIRVSDSTGAAVEYKYNGQNQCVYEKRKLNDQLVQTFRYQYDAAGRMAAAVSSMDKPDGSRGVAETRYDYDKSGNITGITLPEEGKILREYDAADRLVIEVHYDKKSGIGNRTRFGYDKAGNLVEITDYLGRKTVIEYDLMNREIRRTEKDGSVTRRFYDANGQLTRLVRPNQYDPREDNGAGYQYTYDRQGRVITVIGPDGHVLQTNTYDPAGRLLKQLDGMQAGAEFTYNLMGERTRIRTAGGATQELEYDARGNIIGVKDGNRNHTQYELDVWGRITGIVKADGSMEYYSYDYAGNMTSSTDGNGNTTRYKYDRAGKLTAIIDPLGETERYFYDRDGRLVQKADRNGMITEYAFNLYGAPLYRRVKNDTLGDYYEYTPEGLLKAAISGGMRYAYEYDEMERLVRKSASGRTLLSMSYDKNGNCIRQGDVSGKVTEYQFNSLDLLEKVWDDGKELAGYEYNADGTIHAETHGLVSKQYQYDLDKNLTGLCIRTGDSLLVDNHYRYDGNGNRTYKKQIGGDTTCQFDALDQLVKVEYPTYSEELFYDRAGNRSVRIKDGREELYQYDPRNRLIALTREGVTTPYQYDNAGNLIRDDQADYSYDAFNRTTKVETFDGNVQVNRYDAEGLRAEMEENGRLVQFIFNPDKEVVVEMEAGEINRLIRATTLIARNTDAVRMYYHYASDEMGSTTHILDEAGQVLNRYEYDAWGNVTEQEEAVPNRFKFTGQQFDSVTQQYYLRARFYNPVIARFTQEDTYRGAGLNLYSYCLNNPIYYDDPSGNQPNCVKNAAQALIDQGVPAELAYRQAYADLLNQQLHNPDLSSSQRQAILDKLSKTTDMTRISDNTMIEAAQSIHSAQYGGEWTNNSDGTTSYNGPWWGNVNPVSVTIGSDGTVAVAKNNGVIGSASQAQANLIFGDNVIIPGGRGVQYDNSSWPVATNDPKHAEARGYQAILTNGGESSLSGARQATTMTSCDSCRNLRNGWNSYFSDNGQSGITNLTGDRNPN